MKTLKQILDMMNSPKGIQVLNGGNAVQSLLLPCQEKGYKTERAFFYSAAPQVLRTRPFAWISISSDHGMVLTFNYCAFHDFMDTLQYPLDAQVDYKVPYATTALEQGQLLAEFEKAYEGVREFAFAESLEDDQKALLHHYKEVFEKVVPVGLLPYYTGLSPEFFTWMERF